MNAFFATLYCHVKLEKLEKVLKKMLGKKMDKQKQISQAMLKTTSRKKQDAVLLLKSLEPCPSSFFLFLYISESKIEKLIDCLRIDPVTLRSAL